MRGARAGVVVVGGGHAGCEAAAAAARMGIPVTLVTKDPEGLAVMPCNPAVGGVGKGHLVVEVDALGGLQGWAADRAGLQFRVLNASRGPAVWGPRVQCDKARYSRAIGRIVRGLAGIVVVEGEVEGLLVGDDAVRGVRLADGRRLEGRAVVLTTGTFLGGLLHTGREQRAGGRMGEAPSIGLGEELARLGIALRRYKTGTPPRLDRSSLAFDRLVVQEGDVDPRPLSWRTRGVRNRAVCWVARTPPEVVDLVAANLDRAPLFTGQIGGVGPRYCPSIEDKVVRFPHHREHTLFLEPEGLESPSIYVNGLSTSLPKEVQEQMVRAVPGLEGARLLRYGYAVEYDVVAPMQCAATLEVRTLPGLFVAGQLVGTSGYEEAAALGLVAGINAALAVRGEDAMVFGREGSYIGVLVDDVTGREHREPYRMLTSRAEHRLLLGVDSARERLLETGCRLGLVPAEVVERERRRWEGRRRLTERLEAERLNPSRGTRARVRGLAGVDLRGPTTWAEVLRRQDVDGEEVLAALPGADELSREDRRVVLGRLRYAGYLERHRREADRTRRLRGVVLPGQEELAELPGLSAEVREALERGRPRTLGEAERLPGMTPAAMAILAAACRRSGRSRR